jgi:undecaprenyl pyrophosphate synthase
VTITKEERTTIQPSHRVRTITNRIKEASKANRKIPISKVEAIKEVSITKVDNTTKEVKEAKEAKEVRIMGDNKMTKEEMTTTAETMEIRGRDRTSTEVNKAVNTEVNKVVNTVDNMEASMEVMLPLLK